MTPLPKGYDKDLYGKVVGRMINTGRSVDAAHKIADQAVIDKAKKKKKKKA